MFCDGSFGDLGYLVMRSLVMVRYVMGHFVMARFVMGRFVCESNFRPNNSKEALKKYSWPEKIGGRKIAEFRQKWQKRGRKIFYTYLEEKPYNSLYFLRFFLRN
jgi:hypothetical protein